jgi:hypothetical protein
VQHICHKHFSAKISSIRKEFFFEIGITHLFKEGSSDHLRKRKSCEMHEPDGMGNQRGDKKIKMHRKMCINAHFSVHKFNLLE